MFLSYRILGVLLCKCVLEYQLRHLHNYSPILIFKDFNWSTSFGLGHVGCFLYVIQLFPKLRSLARLITELPFTFPVSGVSNQISRFSELII